VYHRTRGGRIFGGKLGRDGTGPASTPLARAEMKPLLSDCAASRLVQRAGAIELVMWRLCSDVAQTVWLRPPRLETIRRPSRIDPKPPVTRTHPRYMPLSTSITDPAMNRSITQCASSAASLQHHILEPAPRARRRRARREAGAKRERGLPLVAGQARDALRPLIACPVWRSRSIISIGWLSGCMASPRAVALKCSLCQMRPAASVALRS